MKNVKKSILLAALAALLISFGIVSSACGSRKFGKVQQDTLVVNTTDLCKDIVGYNGPTPLKITVIDGVVASVEALPNVETPRFFQYVLASGLLDAVVGKTPAEAAQMPLDAVSGATFSSNALIANLRAGLKEAESTGGK